MHRSRLVGIRVGTPAEHLDNAVEFWSAALGAAVMCAPGGHLLRVVPVHRIHRSSVEFTRVARTWR